ncbi:MAG: hypothetical protein U0166_06455 [Acidobacteriota bacterium]
MRALTILGTIGIVALLGACGRETVAAAPPAPSAAAPSVSKVASWDDVVADVKSHLDRAADVAATGKAAEAKELVHDAYFASFEALGLETAIRENISAKRAFELEEIFADLRKDLGDNDVPAFRQLTLTLLGELSHDAAELTAARVALPS